MNASFGRHARRLSALALALALLASTTTVPSDVLAQSSRREARPDPELDPLRERLRMLEIDPRNSRHAAYERLRARLAVDAVAEARKRERPQALALARLRVETAETAVRSEAADAQLQQLELERSELLIEASRRDAARARAEAERLRVQLQIQAEDMARLRESVENESLARQEAESTLDAVAGAEVEKLRAAREREAELKRLEAELSAGDAPPAKPSGGSKPKPKPKSKPKR